MYIVKIIFKSAVFNKNLVEPIATMIFDDFILIKMSSLLNIFRKEF